MAEEVTPPAPQTAPQQQKSVPLAPHRVPLHQRVNVWKFSAKDKDGNIVEASPGAPFFVFRGPTSKQEVIEAAKIYFGNHRLDAMRAGLDDPGYVIDEASIQPAGESRQTEESVGVWQPPGAVPVQMPNADVIAENNQRVIEEKLGGAL